MYHVSTIKWTSEDLKVASMNNWHAKSQKETPSLTIEEK